MGSNVPAMNEEVTGTNLAESNNEGTGSNPIKNLIFQASLRNF